MYTHRIHLFELGRNLTNSALDQASVICYVQNKQIDHETRGVKVFDPISVIHMATDFIDKRLRGGLIQNVIDDNCKNQAFTDTNQKEHARIAEGLFVPVRTLTIKWPHTDSR